MTKTTRFLAVVASALALQAAARAVYAVDGPDRPRIITRSHPGPSTRSKPSSFAPRGHSKRRVYGAPISKPILHSRKPAPKGTKAEPKRTVSG